ncbi:Uncharacterised protein [uncultured archaeon]|nr:Uncharacterised protein [uncultured archaeon]
MKMALAATAAIALLLLFGCTQIFPFQPANSSNRTAENQSVLPQPSEERPPLPPAETAKNQTAPAPENPPVPVPEDQTNPQPAESLKQRVGYVNISQIAGSGLTVVSAFDRGTVIAYTINRSGYFNTTVSSNRSHIVFLKDKDHLVRAMAVSLPLDPAYLVFNARSTAKAALWAGGALGELENERLLAKIGYLNCWGNFYGHLLKRLPKESFDNITTSYYYKTYYSTCIKEMNETGLPNPGPLPPQN